MGSQPSLRVPRTALAMENSTWICRTFGEAREPGVRRFGHVREDAANKSGLLVVLGIGANLALSSALDPCLTRIDQRRVAAERGHRMVAAPILFALESLGRGIAGIVKVQAVTSGVGVQAYPPVAAFGKADV